MFAHTATASHVSVHRATISSNAAGNVRRDALRAHSKVAWNLFNDLFDRGELGLHYGKLLRAHIFCCCGTDSHTKTQQQIAEQASIPQDRVKDQMRKLEETGWIAHTRKGNTWRTTVTAYLPLDDAVVVLAEARGWKHEAALEYLHTLKARGVRLPWNLPQAIPSPMVSMASDNGMQGPSVVVGHEEVSHPNTLITAAREARTSGNAEQAFDILLQAVELLVQERPAQPAPTFFLGLQPGGINPPSEGEAIHPANHPAIYNTSNQNLSPELMTPLFPPKGSRSEEEVADSEATRLLLAEHCEDPKWLLRCASIPEHVVSAAIRKVDPVRPKGDRRRPGLILKTLGRWLTEWEQSGEWPLPERNGNVAHSVTIPSGSTTEAVAAGENKHKKLWQDVLERLQQQLSETDFVTWIAQTRLYDIDGERIIVGTPNIFVHQEVEGRFSDMIRHAGFEVLGYVPELQVVIGN